MTAEELRCALVTVWRSKRSCSDLHLTAISSPFPGQYVGAIAGYQVILHLWEMYETEDAPGHSRLRNPPRTRNALLVLCSVAAARYSPQARLSELAVRGESMTAMKRLDSRRRGLDTRTLRVFGFTPVWGMI